MPSEIVPASSITRLKFHCDYFVEVERLCLAYQYMAKKYTNITEAEFDRLNLSDYEPSERKHIYLNGYLDFLKLIGPTQHELTLNYVPDGVDPFEALDAVDSRIQYLDLYGRESETILRDLSQSNQAKYVQGLKLTDMDIDSIHVIKNMTCLTALFIDMRLVDTRSVDLVKCLQARSSSLKTLTINSRRIIADPPDILLESIETLSITCTTLSTELGDVISSCFLNLIKLKLDFEYLQDTNITLKSPRLQYATFSRDTYALKCNSEYGLSLKSPTQSILSIIFALANKYIK